MNSPGNEKIEIRKLEDNVLRLEKELESAREENDQIKESLQDKEVRIDVQSVQIQCLKETLETIEKENNLRQSRDKQEKDEILGKMSLNKEAEERIKKEKDNHYTKLMMEFENLKKEKIAVEEKMKISIEKLQKENKQLNQTWERNYKQAQEQLEQKLQKQIEDLIKEKEAAGTQLSDLQQQLADVQSSIKATNLLKEDRKHLAQQVSELTTNNENLVQERRKLVDKNDALKESLQHLITQVETLAVQLNDAELTNFSFV